MIIIFNVLISSQGIHQYPPLLIHTHKQIIIIKECIQPPYTDRVGPASAGKEKYCTKYSVKTLIFIVH